MAAPALLSGARTIITVNNVVVAVGHVMDYHIGTAHAPLNVVDQVIPAELMPATVESSLTIRTYRKPDEDSVTLGFATAAVDSASSQDAFSSSRYVTIECRDNQTDRTILYVPRAVCQGRSGSVESEGLWEETMQFTGIGFRDGIVAQGLLPAVQGLFS
jgi:hypothetical protein